VLAIARLIERVNGADVGMVEGGGGTRLLFEPLDAGGIAGEVGRQELERDLPPEAKLRREPHFTHSSLTEEGDDFVRADSCARL
jgi:hypothetical protein